MMESPGPSLPHLHDIPNQGRRRYQATDKILARYMETTVRIVTTLNPVIGYDKATELATEAYKSGKGLLEVIREKKILTDQQITDLSESRQAYQSRYGRLSEEKIRDVRTTTVRNNSHLKENDSWNRSHYRKLAVVAAGVVLTATECG